MSSLSKSQPVPRPSTAEINGRLWGSRARDWAEIQEGQCRAVYDEVFERAAVSADTEYLDAGCGAGMAAQMAASRGARVSGLDAADNLLAIARRRVPAGVFRSGDMEELPFADDAFDLVTGFNSFQYAANPVTALAQAKRVARPGGRVVVVTWGEPEGMEAASLIAALKPLLPPSPPGASGPFALSEETALRAFVKSGGLTTSEVFDVASPWWYPDLATGLRGSSPPAPPCERWSTPAKKPSMRLMRPFSRLSGKRTVATVSVRPFAVCSPAREARTNRNTSACECDTKRPR